MKNALIYDHELTLCLAIKDPNNKHSALCALVQELPKSHYNTLRAVMLHLNRVTTLASVNKMTTHNVGIVFGRECPGGGSWDSADDQCSHFDEVFGPVERVCRYGRQSPDDTVDGGVCPRRLQRSEGVRRISALGALHRKRE